MKVSIRDSAVLRAIRPLELAVYLRAKGWREVDHSEGSHAVWIHETDGTGEAIELLLPLNPDLRDVAPRMAEALQALEAVEDRSQLDILSDIDSSLLPRNSRNLLVEREPPRQT